MEIEKVSPLRKAIEGVFSRLGITNSIIAKEYFESPDFTHSCCILEYGKEKYVYFTDMPEDGIIDIITWKQKRYSDGRIPIPLMLPSNPATNIFRGSIKEFEDFLIRVLIYDDNE